ncbi:unnamed protein product [Cyprideis torosa]|uniref:Uncharacterized protein n=1 Tax=Cyprideis torosa TaxID=163714 RepID=A0A7R8W6C5_9CRUS|nr:unnamed protein product [Cyprideis torosa]CAG0886369.1 unnamed protein product [Cyprideis torosa]
MITIVVAEWAGCVQTLEFFEVLRDTEFSILGDGGYGISPQVMLPFRNPSTQASRMKRKSGTKQQREAELVHAIVKEVSHLSSHHTRPPGSDQDDVLDPSERNLLRKPPSKPFSHCFRGPLLLVAEPLRKKQRKY